MWKYETRDEKPTKVPYRVSGTGRASATDPTSWAPYDACRKVFDLQSDRYAGIGFVLSSDDDLVCVDLDNKESHQDKIPEYTALAVKFGSFAEVSISGKGIHIWCKGKKPGTRCRRGDIEIYETGRFIAITGWQIPGTPGDIRSSQVAIDELYESVEKKRLPRVFQDSSCSDDLSDETIINLAEKHQSKFSRLFRGDTSGYDSHSNADLALCNILVFYTRDAIQIDRIFRRSGLNREKWDREDYRIRTITEALNEVTGQYDPHYRLKESSKKPGTRKDQVDPLPFEDEAFEIIRSGKVISFFRETYKTLHSGDSEICDIVTLAGAAAAATTSKGIQPGFSGMKGAGKTTGTRAALHLWPEEYIVDGGLSNKALFYHESLVPGCAVFSDDTYLPEDLLQSIKAAMSAFQQGAVYLTVGKGPKGGNVAIKKKIPPRTIFLFTSIDDSGDQELSDRQYKLSLQPGVDAKKNRIKFLQERMEEGREELPLTREVQICRQILRTIKAKTFKVRIPFSKGLKFSNINNMRDIEQFYDFLQAVTILNYPNRSSVADATGLITITAVEEDFDIAKTIYKAADDTRQYKITKQERALIDWLCENHKVDGITEGDLISQFGNKRDGKIVEKVSRGTVRRLLYGKDGGGGLCNKVPGVYVQKEQIPNKHDRDSKILANVIYCDPALKSSLSDYMDFVTLKSDNPGPPLVKNESVTIEPIVPVQKVFTHADTPFSDEPLPESLSDWVKLHNTPALPSPDQYTFLTGKSGSCRCVVKGCSDIPLRAVKGTLPLCQKHYSGFQSLWEKEHRWAE